MDSARDAPRGAHRHVRIVTVHVHAQVDSDVGHFGPDGAQADDAQLLALHLASGERLLRLLGRLRDVLVVGVVPAPGDAAGDVAAAQHEAAHHDLLHGVRVRAGGVEHHDALFGATVERDVVHAGARAGNGLEAFGERGVVQGGTADEHAFRLGEVVDELVVVGEQVGAVRRDVVEAVDVAHEVSFEDGGRLR